MKKLNFHKNYNCLLPSQSNLNKKESEFSLAPIKQKIDTFKNKLKPSSYHGTYGNYSLLKSANSYQSLLGILDEKSSALHGTFRPLNNSPYSDKKNEPKLLHYVSQKLIIFHGSILKILNNSYDFSYLKNSILREVDSLELLTDQGLYYLILDAISPSQCQIMTQSKMNLIQEMIPLLLELLELQEYLESKDLKKEIMFIKRKVSNFINPDKNLTENPLNSSSDTLLNLFLRMEQKIAS